MRKLFAVLGLAMVLGAPAAAGELEIPDPSAIDEATLSPIGSNNELFVSAAVDAKVRGMLRRLGVPGIATASTTIQVSGGLGQGAPTIEMCTVHAAPTARSITNVCLAVGVGIAVQGR